MVFVIINLYYYSQLIWYMYIIYITGFNLLLLVTGFDYIIYSTSTLISFIIMKYKEILGDKN